MRFSARGDFTTVSVEGENSGTNTENCQLAAVVESRQLQNLPSSRLTTWNSRSPSPAYRSSVKVAFLKDVNIEVSGARPRSINFLLHDPEINVVGVGDQAFQPNILDLFQSVRSSQTRQPLSTVVLAVPSSTWSPRPEQTPSTVQSSSGTAVRALIHSTA